MEATTRIFTTDDSIDLVADCWGDPEATAVIFSHGSGQTRHSWGATAQLLARQGWYAVAYDHRGHGDSSWAPAGQYTIGGFAKDLQMIASHMVAGDRNDIFTESVVDFLSRQQASASQV
jgi:pimeloyl-ACP methyl ester carboxylesterase